MKNYKQLTYKKLHLTLECKKFIYWTPRILSIIFICFLTIFSFDVFEMKLNFWQTTVALFIHNLPSLLLAVIIWISWKREIVGGVAFILAGIAHLISSLMRNTIDPWYITLAISLILDGPAFLIGILFLIGWFKKKK